MGIYKPEPHWSAEERKVLRYLCKLLIQNWDCNDEQTNIPIGHIALSDREANKLASLIKDLLDLPEFMQNSFFIENIMNKPREANLREIFLSRRKNLGRDRSMGFMNWGDFKKRFGIGEGSSSPVRKMPYSHFLKMETLLFERLEIDPQIVHMLMKVMATNEEGFNSLLKSKKNLPANSVTKVFKSMLREDGPKMSNFLNVISKIRMSAAITIIANGTVMFSTRDWGVTGTISSVTGTLMQLKK